MRILWTRCTQSLMGLTLGRCFSSFPPLSLSKTLGSYIVSFYAGLRMVMDRLVWDEIYREGGKGEG